MIGIGTILHELGGGSPKNASDYYGRKIVKASFGGDEFKLTFDDGVTIKVWDDGQSCCENRYMTTDDDPKVLEGTVLKEIRVSHADGSSEDSYDSHEIAFLDVVTDKATIQFATHNEHNGYYGGFGLSVDEVK